jgi:dynein heavy chain
MVRDLDLMKRSLSIYLESKRMVFPRLYFLSDTDLIQLLGESRDPQLISKTICKSFDGIGNLEFRETERFKIIQLEIF